jgi:hypothetical protein
MPDARSLVAGLLVACSVKLLDDLVDSGPEDDLYPSRAAYCALSLCVACLAAAGVAVPLFLACYAFGMLLKPQSDGRSPLLRAAEPMVVCLVLLCGCGLLRGSTALILAGFAQLVDDVLDYRADFGRATGNLASRFGTVECALVGGACLLAATALDPALTMCGLAGALMVWAVERVVVGRGGGAR